MGTFLKPRISVLILILVNIFVMNAEVIISKPPSLSTHYKFLRHARDCFKLDEDKTEPQCEFWVSKNASSLTIECPLIKNSKGLETPALRIFGEFDIFLIKCTASYPLDFLYHGVQPTEAMFIEWSKDIHPEADLMRQNYTVEVKVYSVDSLFNYFNNPLNSYYEEPEEGLPHKVKHAYSRSGVYSFPGIFQQSVEKSFNIFLEDSAEPSLLQNNRTNAITFVPGTNTLTIPCIPSHYGNNVRVSGSGPSGPLDSATWNPLEGFVINIAQQKVQALDAFNGDYSCFLTIGNDRNVLDTLKFKYPYDKPSQFGLDNFDPMKNGGQIDITGEFTGQFPGQISYTRFIHPICNTRDPNNYVDPEKVEMISVPTPNFGSMRLIQHFALPQFRNRSYTAKTVKGGWDDLTRQLRLANGVNQRMGTVYCTTGRAEKIQDFGSGIRVVKLIPFNFGLDWATFNRLTSPIEVHFGILPLGYAAKQPIYFDTEVTFECRVNVPVLVKPVVWFITTTDNNTKQVKIDFDLNYDTSLLKLNISENLKNVSCASSYWYSDFWRNISYRVNATRAIKPEFQNVTEIVELELGARGRSIRCGAKGVPTPDVYFERGGFRLKGLETNVDGIQTAVLEISSVEMSNEGVYTCIAKNVYETKHQFRVNVKEKDQGGSTDWTLIIIIPLLVFALTTLGAYVYMKYFRPEKTGLTKQEIEDFMKGLSQDEAQIAEDGNDLTHEFAVMRPYVKEYEVPASRFKIDESKVLGKGAFGLVLQGTVDDTLVAVKTVQRNADKQYLKALLSELKIMIHLGEHENLVAIVGACTKDLRRGFVYVFVKYLVLGNLQTYLRNRQHCFDPLQSTTDLNPAKYYHSNNSKDAKSHAFGLRDMISWAMQVANGMEYLASKHVIHGDLAARNVLLDENRVAKVTDFGLSRQLYDYNDYIKKQSEPLPWRWMSLESLKYLSFSKQSDIWSYGVTMWEIFSLGEIPYPGYTWNLDFVDDLENGLRMSRPKYGNADIFGIMASCWNAEPSKRPPFATMKKQLSYMIEPKVQNPPSQEQNNSSDLDLTGIDVEEDNSTNSQKVVDSNATIVEIPLQRINSTTSNNSKKAGYDDYRNPKP